MCFSKGHLLIVMENVFCKGHKKGSQGRLLHITSVLVRSLLKETQLKYLTSIEFLQWHNCSYMPCLACWPKESLHFNSVIGWIMAGGIHKQQKAQENSTPPNPLWPRHNINLNSFSASDVDCALGQGHDAPNN